MDKKIVCFKSLYETKQLHFQCFLNTQHSTCVLLLTFPNHKMRLRPSSFLCLSDSLAKLGCSPDRAHGPCTKAVSSLQRPASLQLHCGKKARKSLAELTVLSIRTKIKNEQLYSSFTAVVYSRDVFLIAPAVELHYIVLIGVSTILTTQFHLSKTASPITEHLNLHQGRIYCIDCQVYLIHWKVSVHSKNIWHSSKIFASWLNVSNNTCSD